MSDEKTLLDEFRAASKTVDRWPEWKRTMLEQANRAEQAWARRSEGNGLEALKADTDPQIR